MDSNGFGSTARGVVVKSSQMHQIFILFPSHELEIVFRGNSLAQSMNILKVRFDPLLKMDVFNRSGHLDITTTWPRGLLSVALNEGQQLSER